jgi:hypothetical protein
MSDVQCEILNTRNNQEEHKQGITRVPSSEKLCSLSRLNTPLDHQIPSRTLAVCLLALLCCELLESSNYIILKLSPSPSQHKACQSWF